VLDSFPKALPSLRRNYPYPPPRVSGGRFRHHKVRYRVLLRRTHSSKPKRLYRFCTGFIHKALLSLRRILPQNPKGIRGRYRSPQKPVPLRWVFLPLPQCPDSDLEDA
jgi:hypothetical protein